MCENTGASDETGEFHGTRLAGDRLVNGRYLSIAVRELPDGELRGYSETLGLYLCWREGELDWFDPIAQRLPAYLGRGTEPRRYRTATR